MLAKIIGYTGENLAAKFLISRGFTIIGRNVYVKFGEIDIIASKNFSLYFFEVKFSRSLVFPEEMFTVKKGHRFKRSVYNWTHDINNIGYFLKYPTHHMGLIAIHKTKNRVRLKTYLDTLY